MSTLGNALRTFAMLKSDGKLKVKDSEDELEISEKQVKRYNKMFFYESKKNKKSKLFTFSIFSQDHKINKNYIEKNMVSLKKHL